MSETSVQSGAGLVFCMIFGVRETIQEMGRRNNPPCPIKQLFTKLVQASLGVVGMLDPVSVYLQDINLREG